MYLNLFYYKLFQSNSATFLDLDLNIMIEKRFYSLNHIITNGTIQPINLILA